MFTDYNAQQVYIRAQQDIMGDDFNPLKVLPGRDEHGQFSFTKNVDVPKNHLSLAFLLHAYGVSASTFKRLRLREGAPLDKQIPHNKGQSVLVDPDFAATIYTPVFFYVQHEIKKWTKNNPQANGDRRRQQRKTLRQMWDAAKEADASFGEEYEKKARDHNARHKGAKVELVDTLNRNGRRSFCALEKAINNWCSYKTIERFFKAQPDFDMYSQNVRPLLSEGNRLKQVAFSKQVRNRWGLGEGKKILWTMRYLDLRTSLCCMVMDINCTQLLFNPFIHLVTKSGSMDL
jgi:hypothetical protein